MGLINAIAKRDRLYHKWRKYITKQCNSGNIQFHEDYRNILYNVITIMQNSVPLKATKRKYGH